MRTSSILAALLASVLVACSGSDTAVLTADDQAFLEQVRADAVTQSAAILDNEDLNPEIKAVVGQVEQSTDRFAAESRRLLDSMHATVQDHPSVKAAVDQAQSVIEAADSAAQTKAWIQSLIAQKEAILAAAQQQIDQSTNPQVVAFAKQVYSEQEQFVAQLRNELANLP